MNSNHHRPQSAGPTHEGGSVRQGNGRVESLQIDTSSVKKRMREKGESSQENSGASAYWEALNKT